MGNRFFSQFMNFKKVLFTIPVLFSIFACDSSYIENKDSNFLTNEKLEDLLTKDVNLVFFMTEWCSVSQYILKEEYVQLCKEENSFDILIISADNGFSHPEISCDIWGLTKRPGLFPLSHRKLVREFILENFTNTKNLDLNYSFGLPVSIFVTDELEVIETAPQKVKDVKRLAEYHQRELAR